MATRGQPGRQLRCPVELDALEELTSKQRQRGDQLLARCLADAALDLSGIEQSVGPIGVDIADQLLEAARSLATREQLAVQYRVASAERLPFEDGELDAVISTFGVMFASGPEDAAAELARVVKPGGRIVLATWTDDGNVAAMFALMKRFMPAPPTPPPPSPFAWGPVCLGTTRLGALEGALWSHSSARRVPRSRAAAALRAGDAGHGTKPSRARSATSSRAPT